jgi:exoribonuclease R
MAEGEGLRKRVLEMMRSSSYQARTKSELAQDLVLEQAERPEFRAVLAKLVSENLVVRGNRGRLKLRKQEKGLLVGTLKLYSRGSGWFFPDKRDEGNQQSGFDLEEHGRVFIPARKIGVALDGDRVAVRVERIDGVPVDRDGGGKKGKGGGPNRETVGKVRRTARWVAWRRSSNGAAASSWGPT